MTIQATKKRWLLAADVLLIPGLVLCKYLSDYMLSFTTECQWTRLGGKCVTCGGTHFVNALLSGQVADAFHHNAFLFVLTIVLALSFVLLNLHWLFDIQFAKTVLKKVYTIPVLIIALGIMLVFFFVRNIPVFVRIAEILFTS